VRRQGKVAKDSGKRRREKGIKEKRIQKWDKVR